MVCKAYAREQRCLYLSPKIDGFGVARIKPKMHALRLNTLPRLLNGEDAKWIDFTAHIIGACGMLLERLTLVLYFRLQSIDPNNPVFHKELLTA